MSRLKALLHAQGQGPNSKLSAREYYNKRYEEVEEKHRSTGLYADTINLHIDRIEGLWREYVAPPAFAVLWYLLTLLLVQVLQGVRDRSLVHA